MLKTQHPADYKAARHLIESGVPIFTAPPAKAWPLGGVSGYILPEGWQNTKPDLSVLKDWQDGWALCAVMGHVVDGLDIDPRNMGEPLSPGLMPTSYGRARTPSGGTHDLIASLGVRSKDGFNQGVDLKAGVGGLGHGFLFLAPTRKINKFGDEGVYIWEETPDLSPLLLTDDQSGLALAEYIEASRRFSEGRMEYAGPAYKDLVPKHQGLADQHTETTLFDWRVRLGSASGWIEGERDEKGRGWEALARDCAWTIARMAVCPWVNLAEDAASDLYIDLMPAVIAADPKCRGKWTEGILEKAAASPVAQPPWAPSLFFEQTEVLRRIRDAAWSRIVSPEGLLAAILGRILAEVPPSVLLPPVIGSASGLNLGVALVARSGGGKSSTMDVSAELMGLFGVDQASIEAGVGSGEGLIDMFLEQSTDPETGKPLKGESRLIDDPRAILVADEIEQMAAVGSDRQGSTLNSIMRSALTAGPLKIQNARAGGRTRNVPARSYRLIVMVGVQPKRSDVLLSEREVSVGTPQRFYWARLSDPSIPEEVDDLPEWPGELGWEPPTEWPDYVQYPASIKKQIKQVRHHQVRQETDSAEGHLLLVRLKLAYSLALLHQETKVTDQWWSMAAELTDRSMETIAWCRKELAGSLDQRAQSTESRRAKATALASEEVTETRISKAAEITTRNLERCSGQVTWRDIKPHYRYRSGLETEDIVAEMRKTPQVVAEEFETGGQTGYRFEWVQK